MRLCTKHLRFNNKCLYMVSAVLITSGLTVFLLRYHLFQFIKKREMVLTPNTHAGASWSDFPHNSRDFYFFNWTNPEDIYNETIKPKFKEVGPYSFYEHKKKKHLVWNDNGTVTYKQVRFWYYKNEEGNGNLEDNIITLNPIALSSVYIYRKWGYLIRKSLSWLLSQKAGSVHITRTVRQMIFEGYEDDIISIGHSIPFYYRPPFDKFGWFYPRNGSEDYEGVYNVGTGDNSTMGEIYQWNYLNETPYYQGDCGRFGGSAGELFKHNNNEDSIRLFAPDLCKMVLLKYVERREIWNMVGYKYTAEDRMLDNGTIYPKNECSCNGECLPSGVLNITSCKFGSPTFVSLPHFYNADPYYLSLIEGLRPDKRKHELYVIVEPITGVPLESRVRVQINMLLQPFPGITIYEKVPKLLFPVLWFEEKMILPCYDAFFLQLLLYTPTTCVISGSISIICGLLLLFHIFYKKYTMTRHQIVEMGKMCHFYAEETIPLKY